MLVGVTSGGQGCADPQFPSVYSSLGAPALNAAVRGKIPTVRIDSDAFTQYPDVGADVELSAIGTSGLRDPPDPPFEWSVSVIVHCSVSCRVTSVMNLDSRTARRLLTRKVGHAVRIGAGSVQHTRAGEALLAHGQPQAQHPADALKMDRAPSIEALPSGACAMPWLRPGNPRCACR